MGYIKIVHRLPGRVRFFVPGLKGKGNQLMAREIKKHLLGLPGIIKMKVNPLTGRVLVYFYTRQVDESSLMKALVKASKDFHPSNLNNAVKLMQSEAAAALEKQDDVVSAGNKSLKDTSCPRWHSISNKEVLRILNTELTKGLEQNEAAARLKFTGPNKLAEAKPKGFFSRLLDQFQDFLVKALLGSTAVCAFMGQFVDALAITIILFLNAVLGALQEQKADGSLRALAEMTAPTARVRRSGKVQSIQAGELVPGDIVLLEQGDSIPADLRILEAHNLEVEESALTGEPYPVRKNSDPVNDCIPLLDCSNLAFMGTNVAGGRAVGAVTATGMSTEIGKIAAMLNQQNKEPTPLQKRMASIGNAILKYCLAVSGLIMLAGILRGGSLFQMILVGISLAVAAIPEGLPAVVTIAMASGVRRMAGKKAVVRKLPAVETLGSATLICTDKTGTITENRQQLQYAYTAGGWWQTQPGSGKLSPLGNNYKGDLESLITAGVLCSNADIYWTRSNEKDQKPRWQVEGDPTEGALLISALNQNINFRSLRNQWQRIKEIPFDSERLRMTVLCRKGNQQSVFVKGAPEIVTNLCSYIQVNGTTKKLDAGFRQSILNANRQMAAKGMRVLAVAQRQLDSEIDNSLEESLVFLGLMGMVDPPRPEVKKAVATCQRAGIKLAMITGDHPDTALAIARQVGITSGSRVLTGSEIDKLSDEELKAAVQNVHVFARVLPEHKLRLVKAFRRRGEVLAMVGDGINDAPAVKEGDIGVAMGQSGTSVTIQASDIVLTDDNFATLVSAVEQGRGIYNNIRSSVLYLLSTNVGLVFLMFSSVLLGLPLPLIPIQLLFLNVLGDGLPALALGVEKTSPDVMKQPPRPVDENFFNKELKTKIFSKGISVGLMGLAAYFWTLKRGNLIKARTAAMSTFLVSKMLAALQYSGRKKGNKLLIGSVVLSIVLLLGAVYLPQANKIFNTLPLTPAYTGVILISSALTYFLDKIFRNMIFQHKPAA